MIFGWSLVISRESVPVDLGEQFVGWKLGIVASVAIKKTGVWGLLDGLVVY